MTYRDGSAVWAFGHPLDDLGPRSLLLQDAYVYTVVNNPVGAEGISTYKLAVPGHTVGSLTNDTLNAGIGRVGSPPRTIPVKVTVRGEDTGRTRTLRSKATDERKLELGSSLGLVTSLSFGQALLEVLGSEPPRISTSMCLRIRVRERDTPLGFCNDYLDGSGPIEDLSAALLLVDAFKFGELTPLSVSVGARVRGMCARRFSCGREPGSRRAAASASPSVCPCGEAAARGTRGPSATRCPRTPVPGAGSSGCGAPFRVPCWREARTVLLRGSVRVPLRVRR